MTPALNRLLNTAALIDAELRRLLVLLLLLLLLLLLRKRELILVLDLFLALLRRQVLFFPAELVENVGRFLASENEIGIVFYVSLNSAALAFFPLLF